MIRNNLYPYPRKYYDIREPFDKLADEIDDEFYPDRFTSCDECGRTKYPIKSIRPTPIARHLYKELNDAYQAGLMEARLDTLNGVIRGLACRANKKGWNKVADQIRKLSFEISLEEPETYLARECDLFWEGK